MRLYLDTEFNGFGGELISMALDGDDGREWYEVLPLPAEIHPWVEQNVILRLNKEPVSPTEFRLSLHRFLKEFEFPTIYADWYTDLVHFFAAFAGRDHSESVHFPCLAVLLSKGPNMEDGPLPHNALADARFLRDWYMKRQ